MSMKRIALGNDIPFAAAQTIEAGGFRLLYEPGRIRYIHYQGVEVLRMIYTALRTSDWTTIPGGLESESVQVDEDGFSIHSIFSYGAEGISYRTEIGIKGSKGRIEYEVSGEALSSFQSKRIGICVHHPIAGCAGQEVLITHEHERKSVHRFPGLISEKRPFTDICAMSWTSAGIKAELDFSGSLFETEDQRNWTDDSFKTYSGPQHSTPMINVRRGDKLNQQVIMNVSGSPASDAPHEEEGEKFSFPLLGYARADGQSEITDEELSRADQIPFHHYRVNVHMGNEDWRDVLHDAVEEAENLATQLELGVFVADGSLIDELIAALQSDIELVDSILLLSEERATMEPETYSQCHAKLKAAFPHLPVGFGSSSWFADLNTSISEKLPACDFLAFLVSPQVHQTDNRSILENLGSQHTILRTLAAKAAGIKVHVSPIVINSRQNDDRLYSSFAAWWTINTIHNFAGGGFLTLFELKGPRGILPSAGKPSPIFDLLKEIRSFSPAQIFRKNDEIVLLNAAGDSLVYYQNQS